MREPTESALLKYLSTILGDLPWLEPASKSQTSSLPLFLREKYRFSGADLFGRKLYLAIEQQHGTEPSPGEYANDAGLLKQRLSGDVVLVLSKVAPYVRDRLVRQYVPFIVPGSQMFLPMLMIDLREHYPKKSTRSENALSSVSQLIVIYHLLREPLSGIPLGQIATRLGYSAMAVSKAQDELQTRGLCTVVRSGKALSLQFELERELLWRDAEPLLSTPVKRTQWIRWGTIRPHAVAAGLTALTKYSMLTDDSNPTYAMRDKHVGGALERGEIIGCLGREDADARMESWKYDPWLIAENDTADRCSLYLSLRRSADERVQKELETLVYGFLR
jgi:hypothetical protein